MGEENNDNTRFVAKWLCPRFSGKQEDFETWMVKVEDWQLLSEAEAKYPAIEIRAALEGKAMEITKDIDRNLLKGKDGVKILMDKLKRVYKKDRLTELYGKVRKMLNIERNKGESIRDFLIRYEKTEEECKGLVGNMFQAEVKGCHVLERAKISEDQKQMVISACGQDKLEYDLVSRIMRRVLEGVAKEEEVEGEWWGRTDGRRENRSNFGANYNYNYKPSYNDSIRKSKNPVGRNGEITKCAICRSEYHWAKECPDNYNNKREKKVNKEEVQDKNKDQKESVQEKRKEEKVRAYAASMEEAEMGKEVEAILDTGCKRTVCGEL